MSIYTKFGCGNAGGTDQKLSIIGVESKNQLGEGGSNGLVGQTRSIHRTSEIRYNPEKIRTKSLVSRCI